MCEQIVTKQKHPSPCLPQELCPGQARPPCPRPAPGRARAQHRHGGQHLTPPGSQGASVLPAGSQRNKPSLPLLQHIENRGTACCWSSPSSSAGSPPLGPPALIGDARVAAAPPSRAGLAGAERQGWTLPPQVILPPRPALPTAADTAASAIGTGSQRLLKATALLL